METKLKQQLSEINSKTKQLKSRDSTLKKKHDRLRSREAETERYFRSLIDKLAQTNSRRFQDLKRLQGLVDGEQLPLELPKPLKTYRIDSTILEKRRSNVEQQLKTCIQDLKTEAGQLASNHPELNKRTKKWLEIFEEEMIEVRLT